MLFKSLVPEAPTPYKFMCAVTDEDLISKLTASGRRAKTFVSVLGPLRLERAYYHCAACGRGFCPRDRAMGLEGSSLSPAVTRMTAAVGALVSFQEGSDLLQELAGVEVEAKQVERTAEALGAEVIEDERRWVEADPPEPLPSTLYLGIDGTGVPMRRSELRGRTGKQADGSAKTREVKLWTVWVVGQSQLPSRGIWHPTCWQQA